MAIPKEKYPFIFKMLAEKPLYQTGIEFGLDKMYKDSRAVSNAVYQVYRKVLVTPDKFFVTPAEVDKVKAVMAARNVVPVKTLREKIDEEANPDFKELVLSGRKKAFHILNMKMDRISRTPKALDDINITALAQTFGILFDKAQIISGEATENIAVLAKIDKDMSSEQALEAILKMREINNISKDKANKK